MSIILKHCNKCDSTKGLDDFHNDKDKKDGLSTTCKPCKIDTSIKHYLKDPAKVIKRVSTYYENDKQTAKDTSWKSSLKIKYNLTIDQWNEMFNSQGGKCKICSIHQSKLNRRLAVDHCRSTSKVRGLLCDTCNRGIGFLKESQEILEAAIKYLKDSE